VIKGLSDIIDGCVFRFDEEGVRMKSMDSGHHVLCDLDLKFKNDSPKYLFDPDNTEAQISLVALNSILADVERQKDTEELRWIIDGTKDFINFERYSSGDIDMYCDRWSLNTLNIEDDEEVVKENMLPEPEAVIIISSKYMISTIAAFGVFPDTDTVLFEVNHNNQTLTLSSAGASGECCRVLRPSEAAKRIEFVSGDNDSVIRARFSLNYLKQFIKASVVADHITIRLFKGRNGTMMKLEYTVGDFGVMKFLVVSKICDEDDDSDDDMAL
jgi:DNA polymerase III sliding clamp (beta) subunit (PCNA family)